MSAAKASLDAASLGIAEAPGMLNRERAHHELGYPGVAVVEGQVGHHHDGRMAVAPHQVQVVPADCFAWLPSWCDRSRRGCSVGLVAVEDLQSPTGVQGVH